MGIPAQAYFLMSLQPVAGTSLFLLNPSLEQCVEELLVEACASPT